MSSAHDVQFSATVDRVLRSFSSEEQVSSWEVAQRIFDAHPEYASNHGRDLTNSKGPEHPLRRLPGVWAEELRRLFRPDRVEVIHGRLAVLGLVRLDPALSAHLRSREEFDYLLSELREPFESLLAAEGASGSQVASASNEVETSEGGTDPPDVPRRVVIDPGYASDGVGGELRDRLDVETEVQVIAHLLASRSVKPPLSLGLFGDWGTGKSFFMNLLRSYIAGIAKHFRDEERKTGQRSAWCTRVLQIEFNAWHYADANLWASLVTRIYAELHNELRPGTSDDSLKRRLDAEVRKAEENSRAAQSKIAETERWVEAASQTLRATEVDVRSRRSRLDELVSDLGRLLAADAGARAELERAANALGLPAAAKSYRELEQLAGELRTLRGRLAGLTASALRSKGSILLLALLLLCVPLAIGQLLPWMLPGLDAAGRRVTEVAGLAIGFVAWARSALVRGNARIDELQGAFEKAQQRRVQRNAEDPAVREAARQLALAETAQAAARQNLESSQAELQRLRAEREELGFERRLVRLLEHRSKSATYTQHLGLVSLIREDLETISRLFAELDAEHEQRDLELGEPPIQRIVLYIDDLDRCPAPRVVQVLEAVHMLLAFPLFTVVVGVDPRWLRESLAKVHASTLEGDAGERGDGASLSTPQDYLEKIFQIPFTLRRVEEQGYKKLVADLLASKPGSRATHALDAPTEPHALPGTAEQRGGASGGAELSPPPGAAARAGARGAALEAEARFEPMEARRLELSAQEQADIARLWPLFGTPRSVKRFVNTYRLLRAAVPPSDLATFEGSPRAPGEYQVALLLLAIATSSGKEYGPLQSSIRGLARSFGAKAKGAPDNWLEMLERARSELARGCSGWSSVHEALKRILAEGSWRPYSVQEAARWAERIARYTFELPATRAQHAGEGGEAEA